MNTRIAGLKDIGNDKGFCFQSTGRTEGMEKVDYVMFPNYESDAAVLGANRVFEDDFEWMNQTIQFILQNTNKTVAIRQHPGLRRINYAADIFKHMLKAYTENDRVIIYDCFAEINSYDLIKIADMVVVNTSTIGMEAAYMGSRVITETESFYAKAGLIEYCDSREKYFNALLRNERCELSNNEKKKLLCMYGLRQLCGDIAEKFTILDHSLNEWIVGTLEQIYNDDEVKILIKCLCNNEKLVEKKFKYLYEDNK